MKKALIPIVLGLFAESVLAAPMAGEMAAQSCAACHGTQGKLSAESYPELAAMPKQQFIQAMSDFKSGKRASTLMSRVVEGFTAEEIAEMADYFAAQKLD